MMERLVGRELPDFKLEAVKGDGSDFISVSKGDYKGKWLVLFFYPLDFTFVCPTEITGFSQAIEEFKSEDAEILGVSVDSVHSHKAWIESSLGKINFPIASDITKSLSRDLGVLIEEEGVALRGLFIIDPEGIVQYALYHNKNVGRNTKEAIRVLKALKTNGLCPINWEEGQDTL
ncbi:peroxiredoxin [Clostridium sp. YIM B02565]|uniref:Peroxiredoxin n=2 Tax=Clostridium paridis TaxID=2803863 RepID=A0A937K5B6_9CLOT|nr:peroxiredoxin [Clostridium paridis]